MLAAQLRVRDLNRFWHALYFILCVEARRSGSQSCLACWWFFCFAHMVAAHRTLFAECISNLLLHEHDHNRTRLLLRHCAATRVALRRAHHPSRPPSAAHRCSVRAARHHSPSPSPPPLPPRRSGGISTHRHHCTRRKRAARITTRRSACRRMRRRRKLKRRTTRCAALR